MRYFFAVCIFLGIVSCNSNNEKVQETHHQPKTLMLKSYTIPELSPNAKTEIGQWKTFRSLYRVMVNLAPNNVMSDPKWSFDSDTLVIYKRLYPRSRNTLRENIYVDRDWHTPKVVTDTIYKLTSDDKSDPAYLQWKQKLATKVEYVFNAFFKADYSKEIVLRIAQPKEEDNFKILHKGIFSLDTLKKTEEKPFLKTTNIEDGWVQAELSYTPPKDGEYLLQIVLPEMIEASNQSVLFYSPSLKIKNKYFSVINNLSSDLVENNIEVKSSYNSVYFWLEQVEDELNQLLVQDNFPEKINTPILKSRFHLLETRVKELKEEVKTNSNLDDEKIGQRILTLEEGFGYIVRSINTIYDDGLDTLMETATKDLEKLLKEMSQHSSTLEDLERK